MLEIEDLEVHYGQVAAVKGISLRVEDGSIVTLIGANGAGKSTTLWTISGLLRPTRGQIVFQGQSLDRLRPFEILRQGISLVPEGRRVFPDMTVLENLRVGAFLERDANEWKRRRDESYAQFPILQERRGQLAGTLSGGEQQMLAIARALMSRPRLLMLDEPCLGLAPLYVDRVIEILKDLNHNGISILIAEQKAQTALQIAQRGYVLETGRIVIEDTGPRLLDNEEVKRAYLGI